MALRTIEISCTPLYCLVENEGYTIWHYTANGSGARPWVDVHCPWYHMPLSAVEWVELSCCGRLYGYVPETTWRSDLFRRSSSFRPCVQLCGVRSFYGPCLRKRAVPRLSMLVVVLGDRTIANPLEFFAPTCSIFPPIQQLFFIMRSVICSQWTRTTTRNRVSSLPRHNPPNYERSHK